MLLTAVIKRLAPAWGLVAYPSEDRYHRGVVPMGGGIAITLTLLGAIIGAVITVKYLWIPGYLRPLTQDLSLAPQDFILHIKELSILSLCVCLLFGLGLWDDIKRLGPFIKLTVQFIVALTAAFFADIRIEFFIDNIFVTSVLSAFWIVLIMNAFNFLDNMDGASAGIAVITSGILFIAAHASDQAYVSALALVLIGTLLGFLWFNFPPARIFMGDAGSLVVGFFVATLSLRTTYYHEAYSGPWYPVLLPLIALAVPLYDFMSVCVLRISQGKSPFIGDTQHFSHRLQRRGLTDTQAVLVLYVATLCTGLGATFLYQVSLTGAILIFIQTFLILTIIAVLEMGATS
jgi:UDP-GlcNAc:undecaprenyl-phosphate GlcNAc-1-phosphate transferase